MMARNQEYTTQILNRLRLPLDIEGFRKRGSHFVREPHDVKQTISLQKSTRSTKDLVVAAVNLCVYSKVLASRLVEAGEVSYPGACHWSARLPAHRLTASLRDGEKWWTVTSERDADNAGSEMIVSLVRHGLPALESVDSAEKLLDFWSSGRCQGNTEKQRLMFVAVLTGQWENDGVVRRDELGAALDVSAPLDSASCTFLKTGSSA